MKRKLFAAAALGLLSAGSLVSGIIACAANNDALQKDASLENGFIRLTVEQDSGQVEYLKFRLDTTGGQENNTGDDNKRITYDKFCTGYTTININGNNFVYGEGEDASEPAYDVDGKCHISSQRFGDVVVEQKLTFAEGFTKGYEDMLDISYKVLEASPNTSVGVRVLLDPMLDTDDMASLSVSDVKLASEAVFRDTIPAEWKAETKSNDKISAYGKLSGGDVQPSEVVFADWGNIYDTLWDYEPDINTQITDAAAAVVWNPVSEAEGKVFSTSYGIKNAANTGKKSDTKLKSAPKTGVNFPVSAAVLFGISVVSAGGAVIIKRKDKDEENAES